MPEKSSAENLITWVLQCYGHCIPCGQTLTGKAFGAEIRKAYATDAAGAGPINDTAARIAERCPGRFIHQRYTIAYENP